MDSFLEEIKRYVALPKDRTQFTDSELHLHYSEQKTREEKFGHVAKSKFYFGEIQTDVSLTEGILIHSTLIEEGSSVSAMAGSYIKV